MKCLLCSSPSRAPPWALPAPHAVQALLTLMAKTHARLKSLLEELKPSLALLAHRGPGLQGDVEESHRVSLLGSTALWQRGEAFKRAFASHLQHRWSFLIEHIASKGPCRSKAAALQSRRCSSVPLQTSLVLHKASADLPKPHGACRRNPPGQIQIHRIRDLAERWTQHYRHACSPPVFSSTWNTSVGFYWANTEILTC